MIRLKCLLETSDGETLTRTITFPCFPYPGLVVGALGPVVQVVVCQGDLDGNGETYVEFHRCHANDVSILKSQGWRKA